MPKAVGVLWLIILGDWGMSFDEWQRLKLSDFLEINPKRLILKDSIIPFIDMAALPINSRDILKCNIIEKKFNGGGAKFRNGDTLLARITPCLENGKTAFVNCLSDDDVAFGSTEFIVLSPKNKSDSLFVYYLVKSDNFRSYIIPRMEGTSGRQRVPNNAVGEYECFIPPLNERLEIASILSSLDNRISLLRETNTTLEAIAQTLFKSWFVDFDPVKAKAQGKQPEGMDEATAALFPSEFEESALGLIPKGWRVGTLGDVSVVGIGKTPPRKESQWFSENEEDVRWVSIRDMGISGAFISQTSEYLTLDSIQRFNVRVVPDNTVLLSFKMTIGRVALTDGEMTTNEAIAHFKLDNESLLTSEYIYLALKLFNYSTLSSTSSIADAVNSKTVREIPILIPENAILNSFQQIIVSVFERIKTIQKQSQTLTTLRDTLLPRLISGQLRINQAQDLINEVGA